MKKTSMEFMVMENRRIHSNYSLLILSPVTGRQIPHCVPGQFVQVEIKQSKSTFLRRPISIHNVDGNKLWLLVRDAGAGTHALVNIHQVDTLNIVLPLGNGFSIPESASQKCLLIGGGVGVAPLLLLGRKLADRGIRPVFLIGARSEADLLQLDMFKEIGDLYISTDDGSTGSPGVVTQNPVLDQPWDKIYCCGPVPMMKAVARIAKSKNTICEVSLENTMACGLGACLCCVENTKEGNVCVCTEGPVFNVDKLLW